MIIELNKIAEKYFGKLGPLLIRRELANFPAKLSYSDKRQLVQNLINKVFMQVLSRQKCEMLTSRLYAIMNFTKEEKERIHKETEAYYYSNMD